MSSHTINTVMTRREEEGPSRETLKATTSSTQPDVTIKTLPPYAMVLIRVARVYLQGVVGFISAGALNLDAGVLPNEFLPLLFTAAKLGLAPATITLLQNSLEILTKLDVRNPELRA